jgi:hypothetical protein
MGQQQLLLIILGVIVVGTAAVVAIQLYRTNSIDHKRDLLADECVTLASNALSYYKKPTNYGGGGNSFIGWVIPSGMVTTVNGSYAAVVADTQVVITGTGTELITGSDFIEVQTTISPKNIVTSIVR